jgi:hypothetical protein
MLGCEAGQGPLGIPYGACQFFEGDRWQQGHALGTKCSGGHKAGARAWRRVRRPSKEGARPPGSQIKEHFQNSYNPAGPKQISAGRLTNPGPWGRPSWLPLSNTTSNGKGGTRVPSESV